MVAPATTAASTPTTPARLTLTLRKRLGRDSEADMAVQGGITPPNSSSTRPAGAKVSPAMAAGDDALLGHQHQLAGDVAALEAPMGLGRVVEGGSTASTQRGQLPADQEANRLQQLALGTHVGAEQAASRSANRKRRSIAGFLIPSCSRRRPGGCPTPASAHSGPRVRLADVFDDHVDTALVGEAAHFGDTHAAGGV